MWPGRRKFSGLESGEARSRIVLALSLADTPVVVPALESCRSDIGKENDDELLC